MFRSLLKWARAHKVGRLKAVFDLYRWFRLNIVPLAYQLGLHLRPNWVEGHLALGNLLARIYSWMVSTQGHDVGKANEVGRWAVDCFRKVLVLNPECLEAYLSYGEILFSLGKVDESLRLFQRYLDMQRSLAERHHLDRLGIQFICPAVATGPIGLIDHLVTYVKAEILGRKARSKLVLLLRPDQSVHNLHFLNYWRQYITVISDPATVNCLFPLVRYLEVPLDWGFSYQGRFLLVYSANTMIAKQWQDEGRPPLLTLSRDDYDRGWSRLKERGVPEGAWFVSLHVRESYYDGYRDANIETYLLAIKTIVARGGWVIRMGNPTMKPLPPMERVIDYAHSDFRSDWMDVFLGAQCRFMINTSSGASAFAIAFGVPAVWTNYLPTGAFFLTSQDLFSPKLCWSIDQKRYLTFEELMLPPVSTSFQQHRYDYLGVKVVDNSPEEIDDMVTEMLDRMDGTLVYTAEDEQLQQRFQGLMAAKATGYGQENVPLNGRVGRGFLRKHVSLLPSVSVGEAPPAVSCSETHHPL